MLPQAVDPKNPATRLSQFVGGGQPDLRPEDTRPITMAVKVSIECRSDDRDTSTERPIYEVAIMRRLYTRIGGTVTVNAFWPANYPREIPLTRETVRQEAARLQSTYRVPSGNGQAINLFTEIFGADQPLRRFSECLNSIYKAWKVLEARCREDRRNPQAEELDALCRLADKDDSVLEGDIVAATIVNPEIIEEGAAPSVDDHDDALDALIDFLGSKGWEPEVCLEVSAMVGGKRTITTKVLSEISSIASDKTKIHKLHSDFQKWEKDRASLIKG